jgi:hypothetical protein
MYYYENTDLVSALCRSTLKDSNEIEFVFFSEVRTIFDGFLKFGTHSSIYLKVEIPENELDQSRRRNMGAHTVAGARDLAVRKRPTLGSDLAGRHSAHRLGRGLAQRGE